MSHLLRPGLSALLAVVLTAASAHADAVTPVSFSWSVVGDTQASASVGCIPSPGCEAMVSCDTHPAEFSEGGATLEESFYEYYEASQGCSAACTCCVAGASGGGHSQAQVTILASSSEASTTWFLGAILYSGASAGYPDSQPDCVSGVGAGSASTGSMWSLVFDTDGANLNCNREHIVGVIGVGSDVASQIELSGPEGIVFSSVLSRSEEGGTDDSDAISAFLTPGRYTFTIQSQASTGAAAPPNGSGGNTQIYTRVNLAFTPNTTAVPAGSGPSVAGIHIAASAPDPFSEQTSLRFRLEKAAPVRLTIFDVSGARVVTLLDRLQAAGEHAVSWNGRGESGAKVPSGIYFANLESGGEVRTRRITVSR